MCVQWSDSQPRALDSCLLERAAAAGGMPGFGGVQQEAAFEKYSGERCSSCQLHFPITFGNYCDSERFSMDMTTEYLAVKIEGKAERNDEITEEEQIAGTRHCDDNVQSAIQRNIIANLFVFQTAELTHRLDISQKLEEAIPMVISDLAEIAQAEQALIEANQVLQQYIDYSEQHQQVNHLLSYRTQFTFDCILEFFSCELFAV